MSATRNDITGDVIASKVRTADDMDAYQTGWDRIFGNRDIVEPAQPSDGEHHD